ncbi:MAG: transporter [Tenacibaculum sp.]|nr:transporter [Tenacibaculum sp.]
MNFKKTLLVAFGVLTFGQLSAQIITDRPDQTESSATVGRGNFQIETGFMTEFGGDTSSRSMLAPTTLFRYGLVDNLELRVVTEFEITKEAGSDELKKGMADIQIGAKWQLFSGKGTEIALLSHVAIPTATATPYKGGNYGTINKISIAHDINENASIGYNVGYDYFGEGNGNLTYSVALGIGVNDKFGLFIEPYGEVVDFEKHIANVDAGITYLANDNLQFDFSFGTGINHRYNFISVGFSWLLEKNKSNKKKS